MQRGSKNLLRFGHLYFEADCFPAGGLDCHSVVYPIVFSSFGLHLHQLEFSFFGAVELSDPFFMFGEKLVVLVFNFDLMVDVLHIIIDRDSEWGPNSRPAAGDSTRCCFRSTR